MGEEKSWMDGWDGGEEDGKKSRDGSIDDGRKELGVGFEPTT
jgi:hypothetical protein